MPTSIKTLLAEAIQKTPSADNSQPWLLEWHENTLIISYDIARVSDQTFAADSPATLLCIGAAIENLIQAATAYNIQIDCQVSENFTIDNPIYCTCQIKQADNSVRTTDSPLPLVLRHTNRFSYLSKPLPQLQIEKINKMTLGNIKIKAIVQPENIKKISNLVRIASEIRFRTREINEWLGKSFRFGNQAKLTNNGLDVATLDLPFGGTLFLRFISDWRRLQWLNHLGAYKFMSLIDSSPVKNAPALITIIGKEGFNESISAGQLMQRLWIDLNAQGIAVHPYYVISDQMNRYQADQIKEDENDDLIPKGLENQAEQVYSGAKSVFELGEGETLHMLFRVGYPKKKKITHSKRLPL